MLTQLASSSEKGLAESRITALVRGKGKAEYLQAKGYATVIFDDLDASTQIKEIASNFDSKTESAPVINEVSEVSEAL